MLDVASGPDFLRLIAIPFFAYVALLDIRTRRVPNRLWYPLGIVAIVALLWDIQMVWTGTMTAPEQQVIVTQIVISIGFVIPLAYLFWRIGGFGGADAKAFMVIALLLPTFPTYRLWEMSLDEGTLASLLDLLPGATYTGVLPMTETTIGVFSITVLSNTVVIGALYPLALAIRNAAAGSLSPRMFLSKRISWDESTQTYGRLLNTPATGGFTGYFSMRGLDLDALRMYLQWRATNLETLRANPTYFRNPDSLPEEPNPPGDGSIPVEGWSLETNDPPEWDEADPSDSSPIGDDEAVTYEDPWGAEAFLSNIEGNAYGTSPERLRYGLEMLTTEDVVWISPGIPFIVPLFFGLLVGFIYGDVLFAIFDAMGIAA